MTASGSLPWCFFLLGENFYQSRAMSNVNKGCHMKNFVVIVSFYLWRNVPYTTFYKWQSLLTLFLGGSVHSYKTIIITMIMMIITIIIFRVIKRDICPTLKFCHLSKKTLRLTFSSGQHWTLYRGDWVVITYMLSIWFFE